MTERKKTTRVLAVGLWLCLLASTVLLDAAAAAEDEMLQVGTLAPEFTATTFDGQSLSLAELRARGPVVLVFLRSCG